MRNENLQQRMLRDRPVTSIMLRIPVDVVDGLKAVAPHEGYASYQTLLKAYISEGLRRDDTVYTSEAVERFARALKKRGVSGKVLEDAMPHAAA